MNFLATGVGEPTHVLVKPKGNKPVVSCGNEWEDQGRHICVAGRESTVAGTMIKAFRPGHRRDVCCRLPVRHMSWLSTYREPPS